MNVHFNLHTHTTRCHHAEGEERDYVERAIAAGIETLGFSDHTPIPFPDGYCSSFRMQVSQTEEYVNTILRLREEYKDDIKLLVGFEAEYYPAIFPDLLKLYANFPVDYIIMGQHFLGNERGDHANGRETDDEGLLIRYVDQCCEGLHTGKYTYLAHPDLFNFTGSDEIYARHMRRLCECAKAEDVPLEINGLGIWEQRNYPCDRFFRLAGEVGNKVVFGIDAHQPERILEADVLQKAQALADRCGVTIQEHIELRNPLL